MRRGVIVKALRCCAEPNCRECPLEKLREGRGCTTKLAKEVLEQMRADDEERRKQYAQTLQKAIAIDFDGCLCANAYPDIGAPNWEIIVAAAAEQIAGAGLILWTCREGELLENALEACATLLQFSTHALVNSTPSAVTPVVGRTKPMIKAAR